MDFFSYENFLMRFSAVVVFLAFLAVLFYAYVLELGRNEEAENLAFQQNVLADLGNGGADSLPLNKAHRTNKELQTWLNRAISESLSFDMSVYESNKKQIENYFTASGFLQYETYLENSGIFNSLTNNNYKMSLFAESNPLLLNGAEVDGVYRWLYQIPVTISFLPRNANDFRAVEDNMVNKEIMVRLQVRRVSSSDNLEEIQIESWTVTGRR